MNKHLKQVLIGLAGVFVFTSTASAEKLTACQTSECVDYFSQFKKAAKRGHPQAMLTLGQFYFSGYGTEKNDKMALKYFKKASRHGYIAAAFKAGFIYLTNEDLKDVDDGIEYLEKAAKNGYEQADLLLGMVHYDDKYQNKDMAASDKYFAKAYESKMKQIPNTIAYIDSKTPINAQSFPKLNAAMQERPLEKHKDGSLSWHSENVEVITVTSPPLQDTFRRQLVTFRKAIKSTGTRFQGKTCTERLTCMQRADIADATDFNYLFLDGFAGANNSN
ncbi:sel1 repeat family protein [Thalassotalea sp. M1531]|uniref:Sel1 repeat family protein n=1 Tax=Thalassotalea algicola TaxID=2716224 RepID=A0A7Y0LF74_9GAMM|nr:tetratricopeptide repeat protein [Thalassotalea algicola]NMP33203.1 sel1 repeat family protein [Thalassotalea algicola]